MRPKTRPHRLHLEGSVKYVTWEDIKDVSILKLDESLWLLCIPWRGGEQWQRTVKRLPQLSTVMSWQLAGGQGAERWLDSCKCRALRFRVKLEIS
jgi:hypothetical protein